MIIKSLQLNNMFTFSGHDIVARFFLKKPVSLLEDNILQLADDIFEEIGLPSTKVPLSLVSFSELIISNIAY